MLHQVIQIACKITLFATLFDCFASTTLNLQFDHFVL